MQVQVCRRALPHFDSASGTVVSKNLGVLIVGRGPRAAHKKGREPVRRCVEARALPAGRLMWAPGSYASESPWGACRPPRPSRRARGRPRRWGRRAACRPPRGIVPPAEARGGVVAAPLHRPPARPSRPAAPGLRRARLEVPRRLDEGAPGGGVPGLGDAAFGLLLAARVLGGRKAEPGGVGAGGGEPGEAPRLGWPGRTP